MKTAAPRLVGCAFAARRAGRFGALARVRQCTRTHAALLAGKHPKALPAEGVGNGEGIGLSGRGGRRLQDTAINAPDNRTRTRPNSGSTNGGRGGGSAYGGNA
eukprot:20889-Chlamydomonas_euryale.AAC.3